MLTWTTDPISGRDVTNLATAPFVIEGRGRHALKIYFESEANKAEYEGVEFEYLDEEPSLSLDESR
jgi:YHS domain-containing protein